MENLRSYLSLKSGTYLLYCTLILLGNVNVLHSIEIRRLSVPRWVQNGTEDYVVLDCDYTYDENDLKIVVKWFFENDVKPFYMWIPDLEMRLVGGVVVNRPDLSFEVNTTDAYSRFRAVKLKPSTELSGKYTCQVSSLVSEDSKEQFMTVFVPANEFELSYKELSDSSVNVTCEALGLFPKPVLKLYLESSNGSARQEVSDVITVSISKPSGVYDAYLYRAFNASELSKNGASVFECLVELPGTNYSKAKRIEYYPDALHELSSASHTTWLSWLPLAWNVKLAYIWNLLWH